MHMDMSGTDMGMDSGSDVMFRSYNQHLTRSYWYIIASVIVALLILRLTEKYRNRSR
jgi:hypothetical protein